MKKIKINKCIQTILMVITLSVSHLVSAANDELNSIYARQQAPAGVVFEIVDWEDDYLERAIPWVNEQIVALREKFPDLDIAVVSHGSEQFALLKDADAAYSQIHDNVQHLISDHDIKLELCLGHAGIRGFAKSDFPEYVDIEASGPSQIAVYEALGYDKVVVAIEQPAGVLKPLPSGTKSLAIFATDEQSGMLLLMDDGSEKKSRPAQYQLFPFKLD